MDNIQAGKCLYFSAGVRIIGLIDDLIVMLVDNREICVQIRSPVWQGHDIPVYFEFGLNFCSLNFYN